MNEKNSYLNYPLQKPAESTGISFQNAGKKFNRDWIFKKLNYNFNAGNSYAITGPNGSGKSTLLQVIAGSISLNEGSCSWLQTNGKPLEEELIFQQIAIVAPYLEIIEEMTATEFLNFHASFKPFIPGWDTGKILQQVGMNHAAHKQIRYYSSGMKQRIKLAQAVFSDVPVLLLDEPCTNFDVAGYLLYDELISNYCSHKLIIVSSNDVNEYKFCNHRLSILDYK